MARVHVLEEAGDAAALAGRVASLEQGDDALALGLHVVLQLQELALQAAELLLVGLALQALVVGIAAGGRAPPSR